MAADLDRRNNLSLDSLNFFLADVRDGLGPYLAIPGKDNGFDIEGLAVDQVLQQLLDQVPAPRL